ncbi:MAG TPA: hypothetical protein VF264_05225 [Rhodanobacteraceae bacterium]
MKYVFGCLLAALAALSPLAANATGFDAVVGPTVTSGDRTAVAAFGSVFGEAPVDGHFHFEPIGTVGWIGPHHTHREDLHRNVFLAGGGLRIVAPQQHWFVSEQLAATSQETDALSSRFEFMTSLGWQNGHFIAMLRHVSNGRIIGHGKNLGETMLLAGVRF